MRQCRSAPSFKWTVSANAWVTTNTICKTSVRLKCMARMPTSGAHPTTRATLH